MPSALAISSLSSWVRSKYGHQDHRSGTAHWRADEAVMDTLTLRLPRWPVLLRLLGRDPLVRTTDRIEALVLVLAGTSR